MKEVNHMNDIPTTIKKVKKMNHYPAHRKNRNSSTRRCWKKPSDTMHALT